MLVRIDPASKVPLFEQVAASVRRAVADGDVRPGDQLPPARTLAASLEVNVHTVLRAYALLRDEGLIELRRRRGAVVTGGAETWARLHGLVGELVTEARRAGLDPDELNALIRRRYA
ncbi:DNA-binding transcriptional regulator YhcF (GntR family) [Prauserella shujinwangii]|uniref:DNA-binding transcriptional regulator YhcF (GntR family) n=1 Tax=Prauserella shujinwangii TaxID=1453103 RepID=A0A2T0LLI5_9PSEU|nr:GntR family transcriptional regulator [Prauserella shujinwangii]PRX43903.1 DNA-binding transcriptional regulator YhcF (GntR family) [Prauserella shujinwangii]